MALAGTPMERVREPVEPVRALAIRLQIITLVWMCVECGVALSASWSAHSSALLAFGSDSFVELLSAAVVALQFVRGISLNEKVAARAAGALLFALAVIVLFTSFSSLIWKWAPEPSWPGIAITVAALFIMPVLSRAKRAASRRLRNAALAADAVQSATCAYLAAITLLGLLVNAIFHFAWVDSLAALAAVPILFVEGRRAFQGHACECC